MIEDQWWLEARPLWQCAPVDTSSIICILSYKNSKVNAVFFASDRWLWFSRACSASVEGLSVLERKFTGAPSASCTRGQTGEPPLVRCVWEFWSTELSHHSQGSAGECHSHVIGTSLACLNCVLSDVHGMGFQAFLNGERCPGYFSCRGPWTGCCQLFPYYRNNDVSCRVL